MKDFLRHNGILILIIAVLLAAITAVASYALKGTANPLSNALGVVTTPIRNGVSSFVGWAEGVYNYSFRYQELEEENQRLRSQIAELEEKAREGEAASKENELLREALGLRAKRSDFVLESARVTARSTSNWASTLTLSKGSVQDVAAGDCVVDAAGNLVGIIDEVGSNYSVMITVVDANLQMGGIVSRTDSTAMLEGDFTLMQEGRLKMTYLPENTELLTGDLVLTSGLTGIYPSGLVVGAIESLHTDPSGMSRYAVLAPAADLDRLVEVFIIKEFDIVE
ncbi:MULTISPECIES: rod shape-determining protein MreC [Intestinimonas]|uniref:rod shape-determining protein MreC n=1 Tax=Intestinimonas TaxID=1392389 RepID=UPI00067F3DBF|nr:MULTISPECIES: rod shape-determining protein MreC [Intestinimonas]MBS6281866.1 rod shape-determining protein MreC [Oscillospiraceae bacterium]CUP89758.1 rod shape-determining protein MreC [Flavonifractor plautii]SCJ26021.1 rod shape-determining protein MreC [uncultured Flavonifractor sp.]MDY5339759.1 rod shape-determining protein MreC [Intestinimonas sp.]BDE85924.1 cell shape-determining protein MreC [Oscillospiraceae bacterium]